MEKTTLQAYFITEIGHREITIAGINFTHDVWRKPNAFFAKQIISDINAGDLKHDEDNFTGTYRKRDIFWTIGVMLQLHELAGTKCLIVPEAWYSPDFSESEAIEARKLQESREAREALELNLTIKGAIRFYATPSVMNYKTILVDDVVMDILQKYPKINDNVENYVITELESAFDEYSNAMRKIENEIDDYFTNF